MQGRPELMSGLEIKAQTRLVGYSQTSWIRGTLLGNTMLTHVLKGRTFVVLGGVILKLHLHRLKRIKISRGRWFANIPSFRKGITEDVHTGWLPSLGTWFPSRCTYISWTCRNWIKYSWRKLHQRFFGKKPRGEKFPDILRVGGGKWRKFGHRRRRPSDNTGRLKGFG